MNKIKKIEKYMLLKRDKTTTPVDQLKENIQDSNLINRFYSNKVKVVLLSTGSYNPVHMMHFEMFKMAKKELEKKYDYDVVGSYISPSHTDWLKYKLGKNRKDYADHRIKIIEKCIKKLGYERWLFVDKAECTHHSFIHHFHVLKSLKHFLDETFPNEKIRCIFVCGKDLWLRGRGKLKMQTKELGLVVIQRNETEVVKDSYYKELETELLSMEKNGNCFWIENKNDQVGYKMSSTFIRKMICQGSWEKIKEEILCKEAVDYLKSCELYQ